MRGGSRHLYAAVDQSSFATASLDSSVRGQRARLPPLSTLSSNGFLQGQLLRGQGFDHFISKRRLSSIRSHMRKCALAAAGLNCIASILGYTLVRDDSSESSLWRLQLKFTILLVSIAQVLLIISFHKAKCLYLEGARTALRSSRVQVRSLQHSGAALAACVCECVLHALVPLPWVNSSLRGTFFSKPISSSTDDTLFLVLLVRNYHFLRAAYWNSRFSTLRTHFSATLQGVRLTTIFFLKYWFNRYAAWLTLTAFVAMVLVSGLLQYTFEHEAHSTSDFLIPWDDTWLVSVSQTTIGYGDVVPSTVLGQVSLLVSCFFGMFALGLINSIVEKKTALSPSEFDLCCRLANTRKKAEFRHDAALLIQLWWRLVRNRKRRSPNGKVVLSLYAHLATYRRILLRCHGLATVHFYRQMRNCCELLPARVRRTVEHLRPSIATLRLVGVMQAEMMIDETAKVKNRCREVQRHVHAVCLLASLNRVTLDSATVTHNNSAVGSLLSTPFDKSQRRRSRPELKRAEWNAYLNVLLRSVRTSGCPTPQETLLTASFN